MGQFDLPSIAFASGTGRTSGRYGNAKENGIDRLLESYPAHSCVIDREEAQAIFSNVRKPSDAEVELLFHLGFLGTDPSDDPSKAIVLVLSNTKDKGKTDHARPKKIRSPKPGTGKERGGISVRNGKTVQTPALPRRRNVAPRTRGKEADG